MMRHEAQNSQVNGLTRAPQSTHANPSGLGFPSTTGRQLSNNTMRKLLMDLGIPAVPHGFRASFRSWCADTGVPREVAEAALGHVVAGIEGAYQRSDLLGRRRPVMDQWAAYVGTLTAQR